LGDGEEWAPDVGDAVIGGLWQKRITGGEGVEVVGGLAGEFAGEDSYSLGVEWVLWLGSAGLG
jgi:hypothetical protein